MTAMTRVLKVVLGGALFASLSAMTVPTPRMMADIPPGKGRWEVTAAGLPDSPEIAKLPPEVRKMMQAQMSKPISICAEDISKLNDRESKRNQCAITLTEDTATAATMRIVCQKPEAMEAVNRYTRVGPNRFAVRSVVKGRGTTMTTNATLRYLGKC
jgi:hypothetical protein